MMYKIHVLFIFFFVTGKALAQQPLPDTTLLPEVPVQASRYKLFSIGVKTTQLDSTALKENYSGNFTELLSSRAPVFIKDYGAGTLATISFRGTNSNHTQVNWNGFPINSSTMGDVDFSLIPVSLADKVTLVHGGSSSLYGSGAIGGSIQIDNTPSWKKGISVLVSDEYGSFSTNRSRLKILMGNNRLQSSTGIYINSAKNNYPFVSTFDIDQKMVKQSHANLHQFGIIQSLNLKVGKTNILSAGLWYQNSERNIPPQMFSSVSSASQKDSSIRTYAGWTKSLKDGSFTLRSAYFSEYLHYVDPSNKTDSYNKVNRSMSEAELRHSFLNEKIIINLGGNFTYAQASVLNYGGNKEQVRKSLFTGVKYIPSERIKVNFMIRKDFISGYITPFAPAFGIERKLAKGFFIKSNLTRNFNIPTLNDRFWMPGGNPNLKPEKGWSNDIGLKYMFASDKHSLNAELTAYNSLITNWIQWVPPADGSINWTPLNHKKVWARGVEAKINYIYSHQKWKSELTVNYAYTRSTNLAIYSDDSLSVGKQLIYVPLHNFNFTWHLEYSKFFITYNQTYTGLRYTSPENDVSLDAYTLGNLYLGKKLYSKHFTTYFQVKVTNIWNASYQVIEAWAMPGRAVYMNLQFEFNNRK
jgi:vitamin B12 transporter